MLCRTISLALATAVSLTCSSLAQAHNPSANASASIFNRNLVKNSGIEAPTEDNKMVREWKPSAALDQAEYGSESGEWDWGLTGCPTCEKHYLRLNFEADTREAGTSQTLDLTAAPAVIDSGKVTAHLSAWLGAYLGSDTTATVEASFQDASGKQLGTLATDPFDSAKLPKAQTGSTGLTLCEKSGPVPAGTRQIVYTFHAKATGDSGDYLALGDNFSLQLTPPAP